MYPIMIFIKKGIRVLAAGVLAFFILSVFSAFYYNLPAHEASPTLSTNHIWTPNQRHSRGTEGFSYGITDANGFNNVTIPEHINFLIMGSSQMEAFNVLPEESTSFQLGSLLSAQGYDMNVYNIGISGHDLVNCVNNLHNAVEEFGPTHYVLIETLNYRFSTEQMLLAADGALQRENTASNGIISQLQKSTYLRLMYRQLSSFLKSQNTVDHTSSNLEINADEYRTALDTFLGAAASQMPENCQLIILLDDALILDENNLPLPRTEDFFYTAFRDSCIKHNILFVDMRNPFINLYLESNQFPHGFSNTRVGTGHLNKHGHRVIAQTIFDVITEEGKD